MTLLPQQFLILASNNIILLFGWLIPVLSSVKAVVRKDAEGYHQWTTYWLILHLYLTILSPILHFTLHPIFQILAILWLSLPQYQGAAFVYDRIVYPLVDEYEDQVDKQIHIAHRGVRRYLMRKCGSLVMILIGEGGSLVEGLLSVFVGLMMGSAEKEDSASDETIQLSNSTKSLPPRHSIKEAMSRSSSSMEGVGNDLSSFDGEFVNEFISMLQQGLYVFANIEEISEGEERGNTQNTHILKQGFKLGIFSLLNSKEGGESASYVISPVASTAPNDDDTKDSTPVRLPLDNLQSLCSTGSQGLVLEVKNSEKNASNKVIRAEIVLSDESDRDILLFGLNSLSSADL